MAGEGNTVAVTVVVTPAAGPHQPGATHPPHHPGGQLAYTGAPIDSLTAIATAALVGGTFLLTAFRRRAHRPTSWGTT